MCASTFRFRENDSHIYLQDANFNVTAMLDATGTVKERYDYTPYGKVTVLDADFSADADNKSDIDNEYYYTGRRLDPETGLQINRNRFYIPPLGRWANRDPIGYEGSQWNLYEYVNGRPLMELDPLGQQTIHPGIPGTIPPGFLLPPQPSPNTGGKGEGFQLCRRNVQPGTPGGKVINGCGGQHTYIQWGPCDEDGKPKECTEGYGFSGGGAGKPPTPERAFKPNFGRPLKKRKKGKLPNGTPCSQATDQEIWECIKANKTTKPYNYPWYTCENWADEAIDNCCLE